MGSVSGVAGVDEEALMTVWVMSCPTDRSVYGLAVAGDEVALVEHHGEDDLGCTFYNVMSEAQANALRLTGDDEDDGYALEGEPWVVNVSSAPWDGDANPLSETLLGLLVGVAGEGR